MWEKSSREVESSSSGNVEIGAARVERREAAVGKWRLRFREGRERATKFG